MTSHWNGLHHSNVCHFILNQALVQKYTILALFTHHRLRTHAICGQYSKRLNSQVCLESRCSANSHRLCKYQVGNKRCVDVKWKVLCMYVDWGKHQAEGKRVTPSRNTCLHSGHCPQGGSEPGLNNLYTPTSSLVICFCGKQECYNSALNPIGHHIVWEYLISYLAASLVFVGVRNSHCHSKNNMELF